MMPEPVTDQARSIIIVREDASAASVLSNRLGMASPFLRSMMRFAAVFVKCVAGSEAVVGQGTEKRYVAIEDFRERADRGRLQFS